MQLSNHKPVSRVPAAQGGSGSEQLEPPGRQPALPWERQFNDVCAQARLWAPSPMGGVPEAASQ